MKVWKKAGHPEESTDVDVDGNNACNVGQRLRKRQLWCVEALRSTEGGEKRSQSHSKTKTSKILGLSFSKCEFEMLFAVQKKNACFID